MLSERYPIAKLREILLPRSDWHPFPRADERDAWTDIMSPVRQAHLARGEAARGCEWPALPATLFLDFTRTGNREHYEQPSFARRSALRDLVLAECIQGEGRFLDDIVNGTWAICEETYWGVPAHIHAQKAGVGLPDVAEPTVDLFAAETVSLLSWVDYLIGPGLDTVSPLIRPRILYEAERRILVPCLERDDFHWMGFGKGRRVNNWNPWCNSNWLTAALLIDPDSERRLQAVAKIIRSLDNFIDPYPGDGGCDEGPGYWGRAGASLFDCLELLLSATDWAINVYDDPLIENMGQFISRVQISGRYFLNFADAPALVSPSAPLVYRYGCRIGDEDMQALGAWAAQDQNMYREGPADSIGRQLPGLFIMRKMKAAKAHPPLPRDVWLDEIQVMVARDRAGSDQGLFVAAKGGHNDESHNHNDVGNVVVYKDGKPILIDAGVETYSRKTFSPNRYDIWTMQSAFHNLPTVGGTMQAPGEVFAARDIFYNADDASARLTLDLAGAYPPEANLKTWVRTVTLNRGVDIEISDRYELSDSVDEIALNLLTPCEVIAQGSGEISLRERYLDKERKSGTGHLTYGPDNLAATIETVPITDNRLKGIWGETLTRIILKATEPPGAGTWSMRIV